MKCCVGICLLLLVSGVPIEPGAALAESLAVIGRDGVFVADANGVEADTRTGLAWIAGPDLDTTQTRRFTFLEEGRLVTITIGYHRLLVSKGETLWVCRSQPILLDPLTAVDHPSNRYHVKRSNNNFHCSQ